MWKLTIMLKEYFVRIRRDEKAMETPRKTAAIAAPHLSSTEVGLVV